MNQFLKYSVAGGIAAVIDISIFSIAVNLFRINHIISNTFSLLAGLAVNYLLSSKWVFNIQSHHTANFMLFSMVGIIGFLLSNTLLYIFIDIKVLYYLLLSSNDKVIKPLAKGITTGLVLVWNFLARRKLVLT
jgi:putative flippase GtrA